MPESDPSSPLETTMLVRAVKRERERFPHDLMVRMTKESFDTLKCHFGASRWRASPARVARSKELMKELITAAQIEGRIFLIRGQKVMSSPDLAELYGVEPRVLVQAVKRNLDRFPEDFMFQLTDQEFLNLKSQIVTSSWGGLRRAIPYAFTENGVAMLSSVLHSKRAIQVNIQIMRTFAKLREMITSRKDLARKLYVLEKKYDEQFQVVFEAIRQLIAVEEKPKKKIGYISEGRAVYRTARKR